MALSWLFLGLVASVVGAAAQNEPSRPVISAHLVNVVISTEQKDALANFYRNTFGFKEFYHDKTSTFLKTGSANLVLISVKKGNLITRHSCTDLALSNLKQAKADLTNAGISVEESLSGVVTLRDPDGNLVEIVQGG